MELSKYEMEELKAVATTIKHSLTMNIQGKDYVLIEEPTAKAIIKVIKNTVKTLNK